MKVCSKCKEEKELSLFSKDKKRKDGHRSSCKSCQKQYQQNNIKKIKEYRKKYYQDNKIVIREKKREYRKKNPESEKKRSELSKKWYIENKEHHKELTKIWRKNNPEKVKEYSLKQRIKNTKYGADYVRKRKEKDPMFKFECGIRSNVRKSFKRGSNHFRKSSKTEAILGCTIEEFREYVKNKFTNGMTFENYGTHGWHLDHIVPISTAKTEEDIIKLNHYTNFQPLWAIDNLKKGKKYEEK